MSPTTPTYCVDVLIQGGALNTAADRVRNDIVGEGQRPRKEGNSIDLRETVHHLGSDILAVIGSVPLLAAITQTKAELVQKRWRDRRNNRRGVGRRISPGGSGEPVGPRRQL